MATMHPDLQGSHGLYVELVRANVQEGGPAPLIEECYPISRRLHPAWTMLWYALIDGLPRTVTELMPYAKAGTSAIGRGSVTDLLDRAVISGLLERIGGTGETARYMCK